MIVAVNTRLLLAGRLEGIGWFSYQTLKRITRQHSDVHFLFLFDRPYSEEFLFSDNITPIILSPPARHPLLYYIWMQFSVKPLLQKMKPDVFLSPDGMIPLGLKCATVPVIHDINFLHYPRDSKWLTSKYYNYFFPRFAAQATRIATVSQFSKNELISHYKVDADKVDVVYNGINEYFRPLSATEKTLTKKRFSYGSDYFLFVGALHPRKNIPRLIKAFSDFVKESKAEMKLLLAGPGFWGLKEIHQALKDSGVEDQVVFTGRLSNEDMAQVMGAATALTFVPYYEGFGIPLVEAMTAEIPVITSNVSSLPEVAGDAALLVDPHDTRSITTAMLELYRKPDLASSLVARGKMQAQKFSWDRSATLLWDSIVKAARSAS